MRDRSHSQGDPESVVWRDLFQLHEVLHAFLHPLERKQTKDPNSNTGGGGGVLVPLATSVSSECVQNMKANIHTDCMATVAMHWHLQTP